MAMTMAMPQQRQRPTIVGNSESDNGNAATATTTVTATVTMATATAEQCFGHMPNQPYGDLNQSYADCPARYAMHRIRQRMEPRVSIFHADFPVWSRGEEVLKIAYRILPSKALETC